MSNDREALAQLGRGGGENLGSRPLLHYLYFSRREDACASAAELRGSGFGTEERLGADGVNWLVLARHAVVLSEETIRAARAFMEQVARRRDGDYDGWEVEMT